MTFSVSFVPQTNGHKSPVEEAAPTEAINGNGTHKEAEVSSTLQTITVLRQPK